MHSNGNRFHAILFLISLLLGPPALAQDDLDVSFARDQGSISLHAVQVPLDEVLDAIGEATGIEIITQEDIVTPVTIDLVDLPLKAALARLLGRNNYVMKEDPETGLPVRVWLMPNADLDAITRAREARQSAKKAKQAPEQAPSRDAGDSEGLSSQLRAALRQLGGTDSELEALDKFGLTPEEQDELLEMFDEMEAGDFFDELQQ
jgi:hypothetical protein